MLSGGSLCAEVNSWKPSRMPELPSRAFAFPRSRLTNCPILSSACEEAREAGFRSWEYVLGVDTISIRSPNRRARQDLDEIDIICYASTSIVVALQNRS